MITEQSLNNLKPCKPGETHNPNGRPKGSLNVKTIIRLLLEEEDVDDVDGVKKTKALIMTNAILQKAKKGDVSAFKALVERIEGMPKQEIENIVNITEMPTVKVDGKPLEVDIG